MSNHLISLVYSRDLGSLMRKSLMVLFADKASDGGEGIFASKPTMAQELCCSQQSVRNTISDFLAEGLVLEVGEHKVRNGFTIEYAMVVEAIEALPILPCWLTRVSRRNPSTSLRGQRGGGVNDVEGNPSTRLSRTLKKPVEPKPGDTVDNLCPVSQRPMPANLLAIQWDAYLQMREAIRKPILAPGAMLLLGKLGAMADRWHLGDIVERATIRCWTDFEEPSLTRFTGIRRISAGKVRAPIKADLAMQAELEAIDRLADMAERLERRAEFYASAPRKPKDEGESIGDVVAQLPFAVQSKGTCS